MCKYHYTQISTPIFLCEIQLPNLQIRQLLTQNADPTIWWSKKAIPSNSPNFRPHLHWSTVHKYKKVCCYCYKRNSHSTDLSNYYFYIILYNFQFFNFFTIFTFAISLQNLVKIKFPKHREAARKHHMGEKRATLHIIVILQPPILQYSDPSKLTSG